MNKFQDKFRIPSARLQNWDYRWAGSYFITICTGGGVHSLGQIENNKMVLSSAGIVADILWHETKNHFKQIELGEFIVMPNHIHGIIVITGNQNEQMKRNTVETLHATSLQTDPHQKNQFYSRISPKSNSVSVIVGSYKSAVTKHVNRLNLCTEFSWQTRFYDHIIRDDSEFNNITWYIRNNPGKWNEDKFYNQNYNL